MDNVKAQKLRNLAFGKLKENRCKFLTSEIQKIDGIIIQYGAKHKVYNPDWSDFCKQIDKDIRLYKKFDCISMWLDWELGLVQYYPDLIEKIAREVGGLEIKEGE